MPASLLDSDAQALINPVNTRGVMGAGLALQFKQRYPIMYEDYRLACFRGEVQVGRMWAWPFYDDDHRPRWVVNFPTKENWRNPSKIEWIEQGLIGLSKLIARMHISSIAIPPLGCGLGGLDWDQVKPLIVDSLAGLDLDVELYQPNGLGRLCFHT